MAPPAAPTASQATATSATGTGTGGNPYFSYRRSSSQTAGIGGGVGVGSAPSSGSGPLPIPGGVGSGGRSSSSGTIRYTCVPSAYLSAGNEVGWGGPHVTVGIRSLHASPLVGPMANALLSRCGGGGGGGGIGGGGGVTEEKKLEDGGALIHDGGVGGIGGGSSGSSSRGGWVHPFRAVPYSPPPSSSAEQQPRSADELIAPHEFTVTATVVGLCVGTPMRGRSRSSSTAHRPRTERYRPRRPRSFLLRWILDLHLQQQRRRIRMVAMEEERCCCWWCWCWCWWWQSWHLAARHRSAAALLLDSRCQIRSQAEQLCTVIIIVIISVIISSIIATTTTSSSISSRTQQQQSRGRTDAAAAVSRSEPRCLHQLSGLRAVTEGEWRRRPTTKTGWG